MACITRSNGFRLNEETLKNNFPLLNRPLPSLVAGFFMRGRMGGMKPPQFSLRSIFVLMTLICVLIASIIEWRRQRADKFYSEIGTLEAERFFLRMEQKPGEPRSKKVRDVEARINEKLRGTGLPTYPNRARLAH